MPCFSTIKRTNMKDHTRLRDAMAQLGYDVQAADETRVAGTRGGAGFVFGRNAKGDAFTTSALDVAALNEIQRKYAEIGVRQWARQRGFGVTAFDGRKMTLVNRRG